MVAAYTASVGVGWRCMVARKTGAGDGSFQQNRTDCAVSVEAERGDAAGGHDIGA